MIGKNRQGKLVLWFSSQQIDDLCAYKFWCDFPFAAPNDTSARHLSAQAYDKTGCYTVASLAETEEWYLTLQRWLWYSWSSIAADVTASQTVLHVRVLYMSTDEVIELSKLSFLCPASFQIVWASSTGCLRFFLSLNLHHPNWRYRLDYSNFHRMNVAGCSPKSSVEWLGTHFTIVKFYQTNCAALHQVDWGSDD